MSRARLTTALLALVTLLPIAVPAGASLDDPWVFEGGGWGHGIGLSQYGSQGMALDGWTYDGNGGTPPGIIPYYYSGAVVKTLDEIGAEAWLQGPRAIWVGIAQNKSARTFEAFGGPIEVCLRGDGSDTCETPDLSLTDGQVLTVSVKEGSDPIRCELSVDGGLPVEGDCWADLTWTEAPLVTRVLTGGLWYARGSIHVRPNDHRYGEPEFAATAFHVSVAVDLEKYIYGIAETLLHWDDDALKTQAVIARSYGAAKAMTSANGAGELNNDRRDLCWCHIGSTASDQNYDGWSGGLATEGDPTYGAKWRQAVKDTAGEIVTHPPSGNGNTIISTFYSSSNGGASENIEDVWGGSPQPWLRSVDDPWSADPGLNPIAQWKVEVTEPALASSLGWDRVFDAKLVQGPPGVVVEFVGLDAGASVSKTLNGWAIRSILVDHGFNYWAVGTSSTVVRVSPWISAVIDPPAPFDDIEGNVFESAIEWLYEEEITLGCNPPANSLFCPHDEVTRGQMAIFISRAISLPAPIGDYFSDDDGTYWEGGANRMFEAGISVGCGDTRYCGEKLLPREQMAVFLVRALDLPPTEKDYFVDDESSPFEDHINRIAEAKITLGCNPPANDRFCPNDFVTRGQMAAFFKRAWGP